MVNSVDLPFGARVATALVATASSNSVTVGLTYCPKYSIASSHVKKSLRSVLVEMRTFSFTGTHEKVTLSNS